MVVGGRGQGKIGFGEEKCYTIHLIAGGNST